MSSFTVVSNLPPNYYPQRIILLVHPRRLHPPRTSRHKVQEHRERFRREGWGLEGSYLLMMRLLRRGYRVLLLRMMRSGGLGGDISRLRRSIYRGRRVGMLMRRDDWCGSLGIGVGYTQYY